MWWKRWIQPDLPESIAQRVSRWADLPAADLNIPLDSAELTVVDLETSGLDPRRDAILSIGAVTLRGNALRLGESLHCYIAAERQVSRANVLVHGITPSQQARGEAPATCLIELLEFCGRGPLVAFHAAFDRAFLTRAVRHWLGVRLRNPFLDAAWLLPAMYPTVLGPRASLDEWAAHFNLPIPRRHTADSDALATGELTLLALAAARRHGVRNLQALAAIAHQLERLAPPG